MADIGGRSEELVTKYVLDADNYVKELGEVAKALRKEEKADADLIKIKKKLGMEVDNLGRKKSELTAKTKQLDEAEKKLDKTFTWSTVKGNLYAAAIAAVARATRDAVKDGMAWEDWIGGASDQLDGMSKSVDGMIDKLELQGARMRLATGDFKATETQMESVSKAAVIYGRKMRIGFGEALKALTEEIVAGGEGTAFRRLGLDVQFLGTKSEKTMKALKLMEDRFGSTNLQVENTNEAVAQAQAAWRELTAEFVNAALAGGTLKAVLQDLSAFLKAGQGQGVISLDDKTFKQAFGKSKYKTWEAEQIAKGLQAGEAGFASAIGDRETKRALAQQKAMMKLIKGRKTGGAPKQQEGQLYDLEGEHYGLASMDLSLGRKTAFDLLGGAQFDKSAFEGLDIDGQLTQPMAQANAELERASQLVASFEGMDLAKKILPPDSYDQLISNLSNLNKETQNFVGSMMEGIAGLGEAFSEAIFSAISGEESFGDAIKRTFSEWLKTWGNKMMLQSLEYAAVALGKAAMWDWAGAGQAAAASAAFGVAAVAAGLGARALAPAKKSQTTRQRGTDRGLGGTASSGAAPTGQVTLVYNVNTLLPPREDEAAAQVAGLVARAKNMGMAA